MTEIRTHAYIADSDVSPDWKDRRPCTCGLPKQSRYHDVPEPDPEAAVIAARILGESQDRIEGEDP
jgi:hypothetical protein